MKKFYMAVIVCQDRNERIFTKRPSDDYNPGYYAYVHSVRQNDNLKTSLDSIGGLQAAQLCQTKKEAAQLADFWNDCYKCNGTYFFEEVSHA